MNPQYYRAWRIVSIASIFVFSFFCTLLFLLFSLGYSLIVQEPDLYIALTELALGINGLFYILKSSHIKLSWSPYGWLFTAIAQPLDLLTTWLAYKYGSPGYGELNFLLISAPFALPNILYKLVFLPVLLVFFQFRVPHSKIKNQLGTFLFLFYLGVVINNLIPLVI